MTSQSGMELELGYFRKVCLDLIQVSRLCHPNPAVGGDHRYIFVTVEVFFLSSASALTAWKPSCRCPTLPTIPTGTQNSAGSSAGPRMPRCPWGLCPLSSLGSHMGFGDFFLYYTSRVCSTSVLTTTDSLQWHQGRKGNVKIEGSFSIGQKAFVWVNAKFLSLKKKFHVNFVNTGKARTCNFSSILQASLFLEIFLGNYVKG